MKKYLVDTLKKNIIKKHGYPENADQQIEGVDNIRFQTNVGDSKAIMEQSELVKYKAVAKAVEGKDDSFDWEITDYKSV